MKKQRELEWQHIGERCARVHELRWAARKWLEAGDPEKSGGMSYWMRMEEEMFAALRRSDKMLATGDEKLTPEESAICEAVSAMRQDIWRMAGELLLKRAQRAIDDARRSAAEVNAVCDELEGKK